MQTLQLFLDRLQRIEDTLALLVDQQAVKDWYTTDEAAKVLGLAEFTVRNYCRLGRIQGAKKGSGRGKFQSWVIAHQELLRVQRDGLLPLKN